MDADGVAARIRWIDGFPRPGIRFADLSPLLADPDTFSWTVESLAAFAEEQNVSRVAGIESRGFWFAAPVADRLHVGLAPIRKVGKLPHTTFTADVVLEYGTATLELHCDAAAPGDRVLLVDDVLATGGTAAAALRLIEQTGATVAGAAVVVELSALGGRAALPADLHIHSVVIA